MVIEGDGTEPWKWWIFPSWLNEKEAKAERKNRLRNIDPHTKLFLHKEEILTHYKADTISQFQVPFSSHISSLHLSIF